MEKRKLGEFVKFVQGVNQTRAEKQFPNQELDYYDHTSFREDYNYTNDLTQEEKINYLFDSEVSLDKRDVVISNSLQQATMVSERNVGKVLTVNYTKVEFKSDELDKRYFLYLFNVYKGIQRQKERELQGTGPMLKLSKQSLEQFVIPVVPLAEQKTIGKSYVEMLKLQSKLSRYANLLEQFTHTILEGSLEE